ncbi:MAG: GNAT family N-acetyltransferase, partial [Anaerolineales bacterium]|nr:GNAT family N-acetyltransferase [Anaerolineales bacterium]
PQWRSDSLLTDTIRWAERRAMQIHSQMAPQEAILRSIVREPETAYTALLEQLGYEIERYFYTMVRPDLHDIPAAPCPAGLEVRPVTPDHLRKIWQAKEEAFQEHWGKRESGQADYERWLADPIQDPALWKVAWDGEQVAGMVLNFIDSAENQNLNRKRGYTEDIAVRRPWRRRGLASHLIAESLRMLRQRGMQEAALSVDVDNPSGALGLYERFGYEVTRREYAYSRPLPDG